MPTPNIYYHECQLCGFPIPFDPAFDIQETESGAYKVQCVNGEVVESCKTAHKVAQHLQDFHPEVISEDGDSFLVPLDELFKLREATDNA